MKYLLTILLVTVSSWTDLDKIAKVNALKKEAKTAYNNGNYQKALDNYLYLIDSMQVEDDNIVLNMANAYYKLKDTTNAVTNYQTLTDSKDNVVRSVAQQQLGIIANRTKKFEEALQHFKEALKADPANEEARYNYELLKKALKEQEQQNKDDQKQDKGQEKEDKQKQEEKKEGDQEKKDQEEKKDGQGDEKEDQEQQNEEKGEKKEDGKPKEEQKEESEEGEKTDEENKEKQERMSSALDNDENREISEEKAKMILEALKNKEIQYYQQIKRKATKPKESGKPDW